MDSIFTDHLRTGLWLVFFKLGEQRKELKTLERDLNEFKVAVAKEYATQVNINRLETKIDELHQLLWEMHNEHTTRHKK